jgi:hypothetical protein
MDTLHETDFAIGLEGSAIACQAPTPVWVTGDWGA